jgi:hypothetical protein
MTATVLTIVVTAVLAAVVFAYTAEYLARVIRDDGYRGPRRTPPRSHHTDAFDPRSRAA